MKIKEETIAILTIKDLPNLTQKEMNSLMKFLNNKVTEMYECKRTDYSKRYISRL